MLLKLKVKDQENFAKYRELLLQFWMKFAQLLFIFHCRNKSYCNIFVFFQIDYNFFNFGLGVDVVNLVLFKRMLLSQIGRRMLETTLSLIDSHTPLFYRLTSFRNTQVLLIWTNGQINPHHLLE